jgi:hypothetical protein
MPWPQLASEDAEKLTALAIAAYSISRRRDKTNEVSHVFECPELYRNGMTSVICELELLRARVEEESSAFKKTMEQIDVLVRGAYGFTEVEYAALLEESAHSVDDSLSGGEIDDIKVESENVDVDAANLVNRLFSFLVGIAFGRWTYRTYRNSQPVSCRDLFHPLPTQSPAAAEHEPISGFQVGLVDDEAHAADIVRCATESSKLAWEDSADVLVSEAADVLNMSGGLREYFRSHFFDHHLRCYSQAGRKAPVYWQLATASASYSVWLYYHRFTRDTFFQVLNEYVKPKLDHERQKLDRLRGEAGAEPTRSQRKEIENQEKFVAELASMVEEVERIAPLWNPNLNDGVIINFAPLWRLVPQNKSWQKECKSCWDKLVKGDYDWAHLAMRLWPERVVPKCVTDASLAIAHGLEDVFWTQDDRDRFEPKGAPDGGWQPVIDRLVGERTSAAVKAALDSLLTAPALAGAARGTRGRKAKAR